MIRLIITYLSIAAGALLLLGSLNNLEANNPPTIGERAPDFSVVDYNGDVHSLSDFEGKFVILEWLNHDCPFVRKFYDAGKMQELQETYTEKGVVWLSVISSAPGTQGYLEPEAARELSAEKGSNATTVLLDPDGIMGRAYDARVTPHMYIINPDGMLMYNGAIDDIRSARSADIERATNHVEVSMKRLLNGEELEITTNTPYGCTVKYAEN